METMDITITTIHTTKSTTVTVMEIEKNTL